MTSLPGRYHYYTPQTGGAFVYLLAELKNSSSHAINPCNIYVEATVDHTYIKGFAYAAKKNAEYFLTELTPEGSCYVFLGADVQRSLLKNAQEVRIRFEFTPEFDLPVQETTTGWILPTANTSMKLFVL